MSGEPSRIAPPEPLTAQHEVVSFRSGEPSLDDWLKRRALRSQLSGSARTFVATADGRVVGYCSLAVGAIARDVAVSRVKRNMPDPIPAMLLARLAIDRSWQGCGLGSGLLKDAVYRILQAADLAGIRALLVHAISLEAKRFYQYFGFRASESEPMTLMATLQDLSKALESDR